METDNREPERCADAGHTCLSVGCSEVEGAEEEEEEEGEEEEDRGGKKTR